MGFRGFKFRFELHASHSSIEGSNADLHFHNFTIILYLRNVDYLKDELVLYEEIENHIHSWMDQYQDKYLGDTGLFQDKDTTIESIGEAFYDNLKEEVIHKGLYLVRLEICENPTRIYSVSDKLLDNSVNNINFEPVHISLERNTEEDKELYKDNDIGLETQQEVQEEVAVSETVVRIEESNLQKGNKKNISFKPLRILFAIIVLFISSMAIMYVIKISGIYPRGSDTLCHIYRADYIYQSLKVGNWYPLYDNHWYNGVEVMRYWGPIPLYTIALLQFLTQGNVLDAYVLYIGFLVILGGFGWLLFGIKYNRVLLSVFLGVVWFLFPENIRVLMADGNLPRALICALLPYLLFLIWKFIEDKSWFSLLGIISINSIICLCHVGMAAMLLLSICLYILALNVIRKPGNLRYIIIGLILSFLIVGIWVIPSFIGGAASKGESTNQVMKNFFESIFYSLNPIHRIKGDLEAFYYGISVFVIGIVGFLFGNKKVKAGFLSGLVIYFSTSESAYSIFINLPFSQFLWMMRFITIALGMTFMSILLWKDLKKRVVLLLCILLILDTIPSYHYIYVQKQYRVEDVVQSQITRAEYLSFNHAKEETTQRLAIYDLSRYGAYAPYYVSGLDPKVQYTFGAGWEGAKTANNIVLVNTAVSEGHYYYLFDRSLELGNDTLLIPLEYLHNKHNDIEEVIRAGRKSGYELISTTNNSLLFKRYIWSSFGLISKFDCIAIGDSAKSISLLLPVFREGRSSNLSDYTLEELRQYRKIYLSGFTYDDKKDMEELLIGLSNAGTKIYIDMNKIPVDTKTNRFELFGVSAQTISFQEIFPELHYRDKSYRPKEFADELEEASNHIITWNTVYLDGVDKCEGFVRLENIKLPYLGTKEYSNIYFMGLNLLYHTQISKDKEVMQLLEDIFQEKEESVPSRKIVPLKIKYYTSKIVIQSEYDNVNSTLAFLDIFHSKDNIFEDNNLLIVNKGETIIQMKYPYLNRGLLVSVIGVVSTILFLLYMKFKKY